MRADRLLSILMLLQAKGRMTAHDLADQLEVSERTIYRDLEALGMAGIPIYTERGPGGGCSLFDGYQTRLNGLCEDEVRALSLLHIAGPLADLGLAHALEDALLKLNATLSPPLREQAEQTRQRVHLDASWWHHSEDVSSCLPIIQQALWQDYRLDLVYRELDDTRSVQLVEPYGLVAKASSWYLVGSCNGRFQVYCVSRIQTARMREEHFERSPDFNLANCWDDYCSHVETVPGYAAPLHLAPDEAPQLPQVLSEHGYRPAETAKAASHAPGRLVSLRNYQRRRTTRQQKKAPPPGLPGNGSGTGKTAPQAGREEKKPIYISAGPRPQQKKGFRNHKSQQKKRPVVSLRAANKKNGFLKKASRPFKKNGYIKKVMASLKKTGPVCQSKNIYREHIKKTRLPLLTKFLSFSPRDMDASRTQNNVA
ncbi:MAG: YafY family transcriptional regulator [Ktedonobacteraceae bacterium]|nr:YafY family transcriptional regulator [Ktedonobacteraceae bacterium]